MGSPHAQPNQIKSRWKNLLAVHQVVTSRIMRPQCCLVTRRIPGRRFEWSDKSDAPGNYLTLTLPLTFASTSNTSFAYESDLLQPFQLELHSRIVWPFFTHHRLFFFTERLVSVLANECGVSPSGSCWQNVHQTPSPCVSPTKQPEKPVFIQGLFHFQPVSDICWTQSM